MSDEEQVQDDDLSPEEKKKKDNGKVEKKFQAAFANLKKAIGGKEERLRPSKKPDEGEMVDIVATLFAEQNEELLTKVREGLRAVLKEFVLYEEAKKKKEQEIKDLDTQKKKELTKSINSWLGLIDQSYINTEKYTEALELAITEKKEERKEKDDD